MTKVVNKYKEPFDEYIGRGSIFGNPYRIGRDGSREEVIELYAIHFLYKMVNDPEFKRRVLALKGKTLGCFCKPNSCHGDIIVDYLEKTGMFANSITEAVPSVPEYNFSKKLGIDISDSFPPNALGL
jgi:hypothetical protein